jgi:hypothetical protein
VNLTYEESSTATIPCVEWIVIDVRTEILTSSDDKTIILKSASVIKSKVMF